MGYVTFKKGFLVLWCFFLEEFFFVFCSQAFSEQLSSGIKTFFLGIGIRKRKRRVLLPFLLSILIPTSRCTNFSLGLGSGFLFESPRWKHVVVNSFVSNPNDDLFSSSVSHFDALRLGREFLSLKNVLRLCLCLLFSPRSVVLIPCHVIFALGFAFSFLADDCSVVHRHRVACFGLFTNKSRSITWQLHVR